MKNVMTDKKEELRKEWKLYQDEKYEYCRENNISYGDNLDDYIFDFFYKQIQEEDSEIEHLNTRVNVLVTQLKAKDELIKAAENVIKQIPKEGEYVMNGHMLLFYSHLEKYQTIKQHGAKTN